MNRFINRKLFNLRSCCRRVAIYAIATTDIDDSSILSVFRAESRSQMDGKSKTIRDADASRFVQWISGAVFCVAMCTGKKCIANFFFSRLQIVNY